MRGITIGGRFVRWEIPTIIISFIIIVAVCCAKCSGSKGRSGASELPKEPEVELLYGFDVSKYEVIHGEVAGGQTLSHLLDGYVKQTDINRIYPDSKPF